MTPTKKPRVLVLGGNFAGLTAARFIREKCGDAVNMTLIDRKPYLIFVPNIPLEVFANEDPAERLHMPIVKYLDRDNIDFIQGNIQQVDIDHSSVSYIPTERSGGAIENIRYDYLVIALGARLAYDKIEGFAENGYTLSDSYYGNRLREYLHGGGYKGGPIAIGSARFFQGNKNKPDWLPESRAACDGPPLEVSMALASWLGDRSMGGPEKITLFSPAKVIAEDAGQKIVKEFLDMAGQMGFKYQKDTPDIKKVSPDGIEFTNGNSIDAELKIIFPNWQPHNLLKDLPITDEVGFVVTDLSMRNPDYSNIFALGDCASLTVPKLGAHGHQQAGIVANQIAKDLGKISADEADKSFWPEIICMGDMGHNKAFYIHSDAWYGGKTSIFKMGYTYYAMKLAFKEMYFRTGGKPPTWGIPLTEFVAEKAT
ncbi:MAG: FAD-dependent oxidoreductase [Calditrichia bacterium]